MCYIVTVLTVISCKNYNEIIKKYVLKNNIVCVKKAIKNNADVNYRFKKGKFKGFTILMVAAKKGNLEIVKFLLKAGANVNSKMILLKKNAFTIHKGKTALHFASIKGDVEIVRLLIKAGANTNTNDAGNYSPLTASIIYKNFEIARILIKSGTNVNFNDGDALVFSARSADMKFIKFLIKNGLNL